jgi:mono/diheme cytochrome c family protein
LPDKMRERRPSGRATERLMVACLGVAALLAGWGCSSVPVADGATLVNTRCAACHSPQRGLMATKTRDEWNQTVTRMIGKGAKVNAAEKTVLVEYLVKTAGK